MKRDPRITTYALGEMGIAERDHFEKEMTESGALQSEVAAMLHLGKRLEALPKDTHRFDSATREKLIADFGRNQKARTTIRPSFTVVLTSILSVAAAVVLFVAALNNFDLGRFQAGSGPWANGAYVVDAGDRKLLAKREADYTELQSHFKARRAESYSSYAPPQTAVVSTKTINRNISTHVIVTNVVAMASGFITTNAGGLFTTNIANNVDFSVLAEEASPRVTAISAEFNTEAYAPLHENVFSAAKENPLSTFSIDVDTASYSNVRRFLVNEVRPPAGAIRTEELINYFRYNYPQPSGQDPFSVNLEVGRAPWNAERGLVRIGLKGREIPAEKRVPANLVFLIDVSGSMDEPDKLPLLQSSLSALVENLSDEDRVAIVTYAGSSGLVLPPTAGANKQEILRAIENLKAGGPTHGSDGIGLAYETAREHFDKEGNNRVILCTDGDFNVGTTNESELQRLIEKERESGVFLSVLGFGTGNLKDSTMELLADKGNGNYAYIDSPAEGRKVLVEQMGSTLFTIAKDVKIQVEFNPAQVAGYRLIGYENRLLAKEDFNNDKKDAGEIGAGHTVTALYEIIPAGQPLPDSPSVDPLKYQRPQPDSAPTSDELLTVKLRYKEPDGDKSRLLEFPLAAGGTLAFDQASEDFRLAAAVAAFAMKLRGSPDAGKITWSEIQQIGRGALGNDPGSYRAEFITLVEKAKAIEEAEKR